VGIGNVPTRAKSICAHAGCMRITCGGRCEQHRSQQHKSTSKNRSGDPFYHSKAWHSLRDWKRTVSPMCEVCERNGYTVAMAHVDHVLPRATHPQLELDSENLMSLCYSCHSKKTACERAKK
jgi:5-methylcytosine-specific restriction protein A